MHAIDYIYLFSIPNIHRMVVCCFFSSLSLFHLPPQETRRKKLELAKEKELRDREREQYRVKLWGYIAKKEVPKMAKMFAQARHTILTNNKKVCTK